MTDRENVPESAPESAPETAPTPPLTRKIVPKAARSAAWGNSPVPHAGEFPHEVEILAVGNIVRVLGTIEQRIAAVARMQRGRISRRQLLALGVSDDMIGGRVRSGSLHPEFPGVYAVGHAAAVEFGAETAALLAAPPGAGLAHATAARVWQISDSKPSEIHVAIPWTARMRSARVRVHRSRHLAASDITIHAALPVTTVARTLIALAADWSGRRLERALEEALVQRLVTEGRLSREIARHPRIPGAPRLASLLGDRTGPTWTRKEAEERFLALIRAAGLPAPEANAMLDGHEVDFLWRSQRVGVEIDSWQFHGTRGAFERERRKGNALGIGGLALLRMTWRRIDDEPLAVVAEVTQSLVRAGG